jgi:DNA-binding transcriptional MerR regulator
MIRIGDFSKLSRVSVKTLRFYDEAGLLKPVRVDAFTGYRYYGYDQLACLYRILAFKDLGFSLEEIGRLLDEDLSAERMRGMLKLRQSEIRQRVEDEVERLERVECWLRQIEQEDPMSKYDVIIRKVDAFKVASVRGVIPLPSDQRPLWDELEGYLARQQARPSGPCFALYHDREYKERDWDVEACEPIDAALAPAKNVRVHALPAVETMACTVHAGPFVTIGEAHDAISKWIDENGYKIVGPNREVYLRSSQPEGNQNDPGTVTELQYPVGKA